MRRLLVVNADDFGYSPGINRGIVECHVGGVVITAVLVAAVGVISSLDVLRHKPLATLRAE